MRNKELKLCLNKEGFVNKKIRKRDKYWMLPTRYPTETQEAQLGRNCSVLKLVRSAKKLKSTEVEK